MARGFLISDGLRQDIKRTIARVDGMPDGPGATKIPTRFESLATPVPEKNTITVKISQFFPTLNHTPLAVGQGISIPLNRGTNTRLKPNIEIAKLSGGMTNYTVANENDLTAFETGAAEFYIEDNDTDVSLGSRCGVIKSVDEEVDEQGYWNCVVQVRGLIRCRVLLLQAGASVSPPPPYPTNATLRTYWRRYLMASEYGYGAILGLGARYRMNGTNAYPAVAEAVVNLG
jgi:hypothetical protein